MSRHAAISSARKSQSDPAATRAGSAAGTQGNFIDNRESATTQRALQAQIGDSPRMVAQREQQPFSRPNNTGLPDNLKLEHEADVMGAKAMQMVFASDIVEQKGGGIQLRRDDTDSAPLQRMQASVQLMDEEADAAALLAEEEQEGEEEGEATKEYEEDAGELEEGDDAEEADGDMWDEAPMQAKFVFPLLGSGISVPNTYGGGTVQRKTQIKNTSQAYKFRKRNVGVGSEMEAWLDPMDMRRGQEASLNTAQDDMMDTIRIRWKIKGGDVVKGHLLNDNLGGTAENINLYPITRGANSAHLGYVENNVKDRIFKMQHTYYKVKVTGKPEYSSPMASFECNIHEWDGTPGTKGKSLSSLAVDSDLASVRLYHQVHDLKKKIKKKPIRFKNPKKPKKFPLPKKRVSELTALEIKRRNAQKEKYKAGK